MNKTWVSLGVISLLAVAFSTPTSGYHITPVAVPNTIYTTGDFVFNNGFFTTCEDETVGMELMGVGGLCYAGRDGAGGATSPTTQPTDPEDWTILDVCNEPFIGRPLLCTTDGWGYWAQLGVYGCLVFAAGAPFDEDFVYSEDYAWMTWDFIAVGGNGHVSIFPDLTVSNPFSLGFVPLHGSYVAAEIDGPIGDPCGSSDPATGGPVGVATNELIP